MIKAGIVAVSLLLVAGPLHAQTLVVDKQLAATGKVLWSSKGCASCHTIGKGKVAAPDLNGLYERRSPEWVRSFLAEPDSILDNDEAGKALLKEWFGLRMPDFDLKEEEIEALTHYIAQQQQPAKKK